MRSRRRWGYAAEVYGLEYMHNAFVQGVIPLGAAGFRSVCLPLLMTSFERRQRFPNAVGETNAGYETK